MKKHCRKGKAYPKVKPRKKCLWIPKPFRKGWCLARRINQLVGNSLIDTDYERIENIEGYLHSSEGMVLFYFALSQKIQGRVVEIGSFKGKSTAWIASGLKLRRCSEKVVAIDPHVNTGDIEVVPNYKGTSSYQKFKSNISNLCLSAWVEEKVATSEHVSIGWSEPIRLLFVDGSHRYEDVLQDLRLWMPWVAERGIACFHDTNHILSGFPGVVQAVHKYVQENKSFRKVLELKNMEIYERTTSFRQAD